jgi:hypothetical protein
MAKPDYAGAIWRPAAEENWGSRPAGTATDCVVLHATAGSLSATLAWFRNPASGVSAHYVVAKNGTVYQMVEETHLAHHAGASQFQGRQKLNAFSIGIEMVNRNDGQDPYPPAQQAAMVNLVSYLAHKYSIQRQWIVTHADISTAGKTDPLGFPTQAFIARVYEEVSRPMEETVRILAWDEAGINYYADAAFARYARAHNLGKPETNEFDFQHQGVSYRAQGFSQKIIYCQVGDWGNIQELSW